MAAQLLPYDYVLFFYLSKPIIEQQLPQELESIGPGPSGYGTVSTKAVRIGTVINEPSQFSWNPCRTLTNGDRCVIQQYRQWQFRKVPPCSRQDKVLKGKSFKNTAWLAKVLL